MTQQHIATSLVFVCCMVSRKTKAETTVHSFNIQIVAKYDDGNRSKLIVNCQHPTIMGFYYM